MIAAGTGTHRLQNRQLHQQTHVNERARPPPPRAAPDGRAVPPRHLDAFKKTNKQTKKLDKKLTISAGGISGCCAGFAHVDEGLSGEAPRLCATGSAGRARAPE